MNRYYRKPLDVERWGKVELWDGVDAAYIISGTEPEYGPNATLTDKATEVNQAMLAACAIGTLTPYQKTESGKVFYLAAEVVKWAKEKGFAPPKGLEAAVQATVLAYLATHRAAKEALIRESAFSEESLDIWKCKDLWSEDEFVALLCGVKPDAFTGSVRAASASADRSARMAIQRGRAVGALTAIVQEEPPKIGSDAVVHAKLVPYFSPGNAIPWAETKRAEFPKFPQFPYVSHHDSEDLGERRPEGAPVAPEAKLGHAETDKTNYPATDATTLTETAKGNERKVCLVTPDQVIEAFGGDDPELATHLKRLFSTYHKVPWAMGSRRVAGVKGRQSQPPKFDLWELLVSLPGTAYAPSLSRKRAWSKFAQHFPEYYAEMEHLEDMYKGG